jgi:hypothetical protein
VVFVKVRIVVLPDVELAGEQARAHAGVGPMRPIAPRTPAIRPSDATALIKRRPLRLDWFLSIAREVSTGRSLSARSGRSVGEYTIF